jgi:hypothetical protein
MRSLFALSIVLGFLVVSNAASGAKSQEKRAAEISKNAVKLYRQKKYQEAGQLFLEAYEISKRRAQLRNAAKAYEEGGLLDDSLALWKRYKTHEGSTTDERAEADAHIQLIGEKKKNAEVEKSAEEAKRAAEEAHLDAERERRRAEQADKAAALARVDETTRATTPIAPEQKTESSGVGGYLFIGGGVALIVGSGALWLIAQGRLNTLDGKLAMKNAAGQITGVSPTDADHEVSTINTMRVGAGALAGAAVIALGTGIIWLLSSGSEDRRNAAFVLPSPAGFAVQF